MLERELLETMVVQSADVAKQQRVTVITRLAVVHVTVPDVARVHAEALDVVGRVRVDGQCADGPNPGRVGLDYGDTASDEFE